MKIRVEKSSFLEALLNVSNAVQARNALQILSNALFAADEGTLTIATTNIDLSIKCSIAAKVDEAGATTLPIKRLIGIVRELGDSEIEIDVDDKDCASLRSGSSFFRIVGISKEDFPKFPELENKVAFTLGAGVFREMLRKTAYAASEDESRHIITGILLAFRDGKVTVVATDGRRLALVEQELEFPPELERDVVLPAKSVAEIMRMIKDDGEISIFVDAKMALFQYDGTTLATKLIEGTFPNYRQVIPQSYIERVELNREEFLSAMRRVSVISSEDRSVPARLTFKGAELTISMENPDVGESKETVAIKYGGRDMEFDFNPEYVMAPLRNIDTEDISIEVATERGPAIFKCNLPFLYVLMPVRK